MPAIKPEMRVFIVTVADGERVDGTDVRAPRARRIEAAYYQTESGFTTFKDADNKQVFTARDDYLMSVERLAAPDAPSGAFELSKDFGTLEDLLAEADKAGHAQGRILNGEKMPNGRTYRHGYEIRVTAMASLDCATEAP